MPQLNFVLPHWMYWGTLLLFPVIAMYLVARQRRQGVPHGPSLFIAYLFWLCSGFMGLHRFYLRSMWGLAFIPVFLVILHVSRQIRDHREDVSRTHAAYETDAHRGQSSENSGRRRGDTRNDRAVAQGRSRRGQRQSCRRRRGGGAWRNGRIFRVARAADGRDAGGRCRSSCRIMVRRAKASEAAARANAPAETVVPDVPTIGTHEDPTLHLHTRVTDALEWLNVRVGEFVAYWAVISVFAYYYEVIARYVFNSPTNWVHESMFLMYGMQYMLCGAYAYREDQHVRVDVIYTKFSARGKAIADIITSVFFFIVHPDPAVDRIASLRSMPSTTARSRSPNGGSSTGR